ncbi:putative cytochrome p450 protein [Lasiodiplodia theobromae]|uniref:Cytochrome p450 n=1 Tax=Lasiodiplodia theobromae TaxID=45133 RepID=UPI0015C3F7BB|nr:Cytochrome p450 [Lasiodiplodia theobromae]KAF4545446.1 Cytochrome p450 [Lasiodiplodia theobromae]KAF9639187.1 putative cytochrome p450 protein [Lasiodiplodia theobromae]
MLLSHDILDICTHPEYVEPLHEEGWKKTALYKMKLMDSFLKESQRVNPITVASIARRVKKPIRLSDGTLLPRGAAVFPSPDVFDGRRFFARRQLPGQENAWQLVTTSADHLDFGHGAHACPGRFFAANEAKVAFAFLLICYDWRFPAGVGERPRNVEFDDQVAINPLAKVDFRRTGETLLVE